MDAAHDDVMGAARPLAALCGLFLAACIAEGPGLAPAQVAVDGWLDDLRRGRFEQAWGALSADAKEQAYPGGFEAFAADAARARWTGVTWRLELTRFSMRSARMSRRTCSSKRASLVWK